MPKKEDWESGGKEVTTQSVSWGKAGDYIKGTYTGKKFVQSKGQNIYEIKASVGSYHEVDAKKNPVEPAIEVQEGAFYQVWGKSVGREGAIDELFKKSKFGDIIAIKFMDETPPKVKGNAPFKVFKTMQFGRDVSYMGETAGAVQDVFPGSEEI